MTAKTFSFTVPAAALPAVDLSPLTIISRTFATLVNWQKRDQHRRHVAGLENWQLNDVGLTRAHVNAVMKADAARPIWDQFAY